MQKIVKVILLGVLLLGLNSCKKESKKHYLGGFYYADDKQIYVQGEHDTFVPFDKVDYESFEVLNLSNYSKDKMVYIWQLFTIALMVT